MNLEKQREQVKQIEAKILKLVGTKNPRSVNEKLDNMRVKEDCDEIYDKIDVLLKERKGLLDEMFRGTDSEYERLRSVNSVLREKTIEIDEMADATHKRWIEANKGLEDASVWAKLSLPGIEHIEYDVDEEERAYYGSDISTMINIECFVNQKTCYALLSSLKTSEISTRLSDLDPAGYDWKESRLQWLDGDKSGAFCYALSCIENDMNFPIIDIIHLKGFKIYLNINCEV